MRRAPLIAFGVLCAALQVVAYFVSEQAWSRGVGDLLIVGFGVIVLGLILWERRIRSNLPPLSPRQGFEVRLRDDGDSVR
jgi:hypothetical protein